MEKKLLYVCNRCFWPPMGGHETEMYHYCRGLHEKYGYSIDVYIFDDEKYIDYKKKPVFLNRVIIAEPITHVEKVKNIFTHSLFGRNAWPLQCALYYSKRNHNKIQKIASENYSVIFVDMIRLAQYYEAFCNVDARKILDIDDTLSKRYKRQLAAMNSKTMIAGQYHDRLPKLFQSVVGSNTIKKIILKTEIPRMERAEEIYSSLYDNVVFVSSLETEEFNRKYPGEKAVTMAMGVDYNYFSKDIDVQQELGSASFIGNMKTAANIDSVRLIVNRILPYSKRLNKIYFIGVVNEDLKKEFENNPKVCFTGKVDDLREYVKRTHLFLSPLAYGTGIKTKILEAMAMGMPVVTNSIGAEGIGADNNVHWYVSDDDERLGKYVDYLIENPSEEIRLGANAQKLIEERFQWENIFDEFSKLNI